MNKSTCLCDHTTAQKTLVWICSYDVWLNLILQLKATFSQVTLSRPDFRINNACTKRRAYFTLNKQSGNHTDIEGQIIPLVKLQVLFRRTFIKQRRVRMLLVYWTNKPCIYQSVMLMVHCKCHLNNKLLTHFIYCLYCI